jgi:hypothetical protein
MWLLELTRQGMADYFEASRSGRCWPEAIDESCREAERVD